MELEGAARLVADRKGDPLDLVRCVFDVFARFAKAPWKSEQDQDQDMQPLLASDLRASVHALNPNWGAIVVRGQRLLAAVS